MDSNHQFTPLVIVKSQWALRLPIPALAQNAGLFPAANRPVGSSNFPGATTIKDCCSAFFLRPYELCCHPLKLRRFAATPIGLLRLRKAWHFCLNGPAFRSFADLSISPPVNSSFFKGRSFLELRHGRTRNMLIKNFKFSQPGRTKPAV